MMLKPVESNGRRNKDPEFVVFRIGLNLLIGRVLFNALGISVTQTLNSVEGNMINHITTKRPLKTRIANQTPQHVSRIGRSKIHSVKSKIQRHFPPKHLKSRKVPINLQERANTEVKKIPKEGHIDKHNNCSDQHFILRLFYYSQKGPNKKIGLRFRHS